MPGADGTVATGPSGAERAAQAEYRSEAAAGRSDDPISTLAGVPQHLDLFLFLFGRRTERLQSLDAILPLLA